MMVDPSRRFFVWCHATRQDHKEYGSGPCGWRGYRSAKNPKAPCPVCGDNVSAIDREEKDSEFTDEWRGD